LAFRSDVIRPDAPRFSAEGRRWRPERSRRTGPDRPRGQCLDLERLQNSMHRPRRRTDGRTGSPRATPWSGRRARPFLAEPAALSGKTPKTIHEDLRLVFLLS